MINKEHPFVGRASELQKLKVLYDRKRPTLAVIKGRRRIGKSRLIAEFSNQYLVKL
jgi:AAA+ ATPase superfamily predicted ATPase